MAIDTRNLQGARASSAVRCIARAEFEGLGYERTDETPEFLQRAFKRGVNVGKAWAAGMVASEDHSDFEIEAEIPWGLGWTGHADLLDNRNHVVWEAYHAAGGAFREEKALQSAFYADEKGPDWKAFLAVVDTTDVHDDEGFAVQPYEINVDGLREHVRDIKRRVVAAVEAGAVNPADKVGDTPFHQECRSCPFASTCWAGWQPPAPDEVPGLEADFDALRILGSDLHHAEAKVAEIKRMRDEKRDAIREYLPIGRAVVSGGIIIKRTEVAGRVSVKLGDFRKAGFDLPAELEPFVSEGKPSERWKVDPA
jgi:hypothetical protein